MIKTKTSIQWVCFIICSVSLFDVMNLYFPNYLESFFTDSLHFPSLFTHGFIQLLFNVMNRIKIINQVWLGLMPKTSKPKDGNQNFREKLIIKTSFASKLKRIFNHIMDYYYYLTWIMIINWLLSADLQILLVSRSK